MIDPHGYHTGDVMPGEIVEVSRLPQCSDGACRRPDHVWLMSDELRVARGNLGGIVTRHAIATYIRGEFSGAVWPAEHAAKVLRARARIDNEAADMLERGL